MWRGSTITSTRVEEWVDECGALLFDKFLLAWTKITTRTWVEIDVPRSRIATVDPVPCDYEREIQWRGIYGGESTGGQLWHHERRATQEWCDKRRKMS